MIMIQDNCYHVKLSLYSYGSVEGLDMRSEGSLFLWLLFQDDNITVLTLPKWVDFQLLPVAQLWKEKFPLLIYGGCNGTFLIMFYEDNMK